MQIPIDIYPEKIPQIIKDFIFLAGKNLQNNRISADHPIKPVLDFDSLHRRSGFSPDLPEEVIVGVIKIAYIVSLKDMIRATLRNKPLSALLKSDMFESLAFEALVCSHYERARYDVRWLSLSNADPPDIVVRSPNRDFEVDIECKIKDEKTIQNPDTAIKSIFNSLSQGLQSLKKRRESNKPSVIAIHSPIDFDWGKWLYDAEIQKRLSSRLADKEYGIVSGIIFSGGVASKTIDGGTEYYEKLVSFRSHRANIQIPVGFLPSESGVL